MLKDVGKGLFGRVLGSGVLALGFWLMYQALQRSNIPLGFLAALTILGGLYLMVKARSAYPTQSVMLPMDEKEDDLVDSRDGSDKGDKLSP